MPKRCTSLLALLLCLLFVPTANAWKNFTADEPDSGLVSNSFVDIVFHEGRLWAASGGGLALSEDFGLTWVTFDAESGLNEDLPSALFGRDGQFWVASSFIREFNGIGYQFGAGYNITYDYGTSWESVVPSDSSGARFGQLSFDLTGDGTRIYSANFHGGLIASNDDGTTWRHLFFSPSDSSDWNADRWADLETGRYYSCQIDTLHADTLIVYAGSAAGLQKFLYLPKGSKLGGANIYDITSLDSILFLCHEGGVTRTTDSTFSSYFTADETNGLGSNLVKELEYIEDRLWAGCFDETSGDGAGLFHSTDSARSWTETPFGALRGPDAGVFDLISVLDTSQHRILYIAAGDSGLFRSDDKGQSWQRFFVDSSDIDLSSPYNQVYSVDIFIDTLPATADSIFLGTKAGLRRAAFTETPFTIDTTTDTIITFENTDTTSSFVSLVRHSRPEGKSFTWVAVERESPLPGDTGASAILIDSTGTADVVVLGKIYDVDVYDSITTIIASSNGLSLSSNGNPFFPPVNFAIVDPSSGLTFSNFDILTTENINGRTYCGSERGFAYRITNNNWEIITANTDLFGHDLAVARTAANSGLHGDWVVALALQEHVSDTVLWAGCRRLPTGSQTNGVSFSTDFGDSWTNVLENIRAWNFAFDDDGIAYVAASEGLYAAAPPWTTWEKLSIVDPSGDTIISATEIFAVEIVDTTLWIGTEQGLASRPLSGDDWDIERNFTGTSSDDEVFAAPVPYSPLNNDGRLTVHYHVESSADVTVEIYDFSMNHVATLADSKPRAGGADYFESWDGFNGVGDMVAAGIYYIRVRYSTGEERWGRLAIVP